MMATGVVLLAICFVRLIFDKPRLLPLTKLQGARWGLVMLTGSALVLISVLVAVFKFFWRFFP